MYTIYVGFDPREVDGYAVTCESIRKFAGRIPIVPLILGDLQKQGLYTRPIKKHLNQLEDVVSQAPMSTEFALSRFLIPHICQTDYALFMDCDMLVRADVGALFEIASYAPEKALHCVKHNHLPNNVLKMDGQYQTSYPCKNWSSVMVFNCKHPSHERLTLHRFNTARGLQLHSFYWLKEDEIGELSPEWNYLVGHTEGVSDPKIVHFTDGLPSIHQYRYVRFADEWRATLADWARNI